MMSLFPPPTALWKGIADGPTILPEFTLANMMNYFVTRKLCDGEISGDFKHVYNHRLLEIQLDVIIFDPLQIQHLPHLHQCSVSTQFSDFSDYTILLIVILRFFRFSEFYAIL